MGSVTRVPLGQDWKWEVNSGTIVSPTWLTIGGLIGSELTPTPKDVTTTVKEDGDAENYITARISYAGKLSCHYYDPSSDSGVTYTRDAGQAAVEAFDGLTGTAARMQLRLTRPTDKKTKVMLVTGAVKGVGGAIDTATPWEFDFKVCGKPGAWTAGGS